MTLPLATVDFHGNKRHGTTYLLAQGCGISIGKLVFQGKEDSCLHRAFLFESLHGDERDLSRSSPVEGKNLGGRPARSEDVGVSDARYLPSTGLVSVTFRKLGTDEIIALTRGSGLQSIEWGGDVHVPPGDLRKAREVGVMTRGEGLEVAAYGSYYKLGMSEEAPPPFDGVLETAVALGAPIIRVWAGNEGSEKAGRGRDKVLRDALRTAELAAAAGVKIALEFHGGTLNDTPEGARLLWKELDHPGLCSLWQPLISLSESENDEALEAVLPRLSHVHVFHWLPNHERRPLAEGSVQWSRWLKTILIHRKETPLLLEFVAGDNPENLPVEAAALRSILAAIGF